MLPDDVFGFELVQQLVHLVGVDAWLEAIGEGSDPELRRLDGLVGHSKADSQSLVDRGLDPFAAASSDTFKLLGHIGLESESRPHVDIMMPCRADVKMRKEVKQRARESPSKVPPPWPPLSRPVGPDHSAGTCFGPLSLFRSKWRTVDGSGVYLFSAQRAGL